MDSVNGRGEQDPVVARTIEGTKASEDQAPFIVVAAAAVSSASAAENDADPNEAFIPTNDDNDTNRPAFKLLTQEDLERHSVLSF